MGGLDELAAVAAAHKPRRQPPSYQRIVAGAAVLRTCAWAFYLATIGTLAIAAMNAGMEWQQTNAKIAAKQAEIKKLDDEQRAATQPSTRFTRSPEIISEERSEKVRELNALGGVPFSVWEATKSGITALAFWAIGSVIGMVAWCALALRDLARNSFAW